ncbi:MAG: hypothetical protein O2960_12405 [Verrucomicrobia bacterium]|nr:hypothetical protein [Verrucomicrobiota bacterium]
MAFAFFGFRSSQNKSASATGPVVQTYTLNLHPDAPLNTLAPAGSSIVLSPDCSKVVYHGAKEGVSSLYWKRINEAEFKLVPGSAKAWPPLIFAPQSDRLAFFEQSGDIKVFSFEGGLPRKIAQAGSVVVGAQWNLNNGIVFATKGGIYAVEAKEGGTPAMILRADESKGESSLMHPQFMPGLKGMIFTVRSTNDLVSLEALDLTTQTRKKLDVTGSYNPLYYPATGHLSYGRDDVLWGRRFDPVKLEFTGPEVSLLSNVGRDWARSSHQFSMAGNGTLIFARGHQLDPKYQLVWVRDRGVPEVVPLPAGDYAFPRLASDGKSVLLTRLVGSEFKTLLVTLADGQAVDLGLGGTLTSGHSTVAFDGTNVFFNRRLGTELTVLRMRIASAEPSEQLYNVKQEGVMAGDISSDRRLLAIVQVLSGSADILLKDLSSAENARLFANTPASEVGPRFSPDGRWIAYTADTGDRREAYVRRVSGDGLLIQISKSGGVHPIWTRDGSRLYYRIGEQIMMVKVKSREPLELEAPDVFASGRFRRIGLNNGPNYDVFTDSDGDLLLLLKSIHDDPEPQGATQVSIMVHFDEYLRQQASGKRMSQPER